MPRPRKPEPIQPGDEQIAREEIEAYYTRQVEVARAELAAAQERFDRVQAKGESSIADFESGKRLPEIDAWSIELRAGGHTELGMDIVNGRSADRAAYDAAKARNEATIRWLRSQGYEPIHGRRR
jgi:hypothetical protein